MSFEGVLLIFFNQYFLVTFYFWVYQTGSFYFTFGLSFQVTPTIGPTIYYFSVPLSGNACNSAYRMPSLQSGCPGNPNCHFSYLKNNLNFQFDSVQFYQFRYHRGMGYWHLQEMVKYISFLLFLHYMGFVKLTKFNQEVS